MRNAFVNTVLAAVPEREDLFVVSGDAGLGVFDDFSRERPDRFVNMGVAEQNAIGFASGLALTGWKVYYYNIVPFVLYRCYEQVRNDICYQEVPVTLVGIGSGLTYSPQGMTHYSLEDLGVARTLPNLTVISPADPVEARAAAEYSLGAAGPVYVRLAKRGEPDIHAGGRIDITAPQVVAEGERVALVFHGSVGSDVLGARAELEVDGLRPAVISVPMVQPLPADALFGMLEAFDHVVCVEEHFTDSGLGSAIALAAGERGCGWSLARLGVSPGFVHEILDQAGMREHFGISAARIAAHVRGVS